LILCLCFCAAMEALQSNGTKIDSTQHETSSSASQPQRERKGTRPRNDRNAKPKSYYKVDVTAPQETLPQNGTATTESNEQISQEKAQQRQNGGQRTQGNTRHEKVYQPKSGNTQATLNSSSDSIGENVARANNGSSRDNGSRSKQNQRNQQREDGSSKRNYQKKTKEREQKEKEGDENFENERFDNSTTNTPLELPRDPHKALQVAEASRIQQIIPSGVPVEIQEKVKRIQEIIGKKIESHVIYGALEDLGYDVERTVTFFLEKRNEAAFSEKGKHEEDRNTKKEDTEKVAPGIRWTNIVKKGMKPGNVEEENNQEDNRYPPPPQKNTNNAKVINNPVRSPMMDTLINAPPADPEDLVNNLSLAIANQLKMIQEQTKMLTLMQSELSSITQTGSSEKEQLLTEKENLKVREAELYASLDEVHHRMEEVDHLLEENQKKKAERINSITNNNLVASLLSKKPIASAPKPAANQQQQQVARQNHPDQEVPRSDNQQAQGRYHKEGKDNYQRDNREGRGYQQRRNIHD